MGNDLKNDFVIENLPTIEGVVVAHATAGKISFHEIDDWKQSFVALILDWDYVSQNFDPKKGSIFSFLYKIFSGMLSDRYRTPESAQDTVTGDARDFRRRVVDIETATEIIGAGAVCEEDVEQITLHNLIDQFDRDLMDSFAEFIKLRLGDKYYTVFQLSRLLPRACDISEESGIPIADVYTIKSNVERLRRFVRINNQRLDQFRSEGLSAIKNGTENGTVPEILDFTFTCKVNETDASTILASIQPKCSKNWSEKYEDQLAHEITSAEIFRLMDERCSEKTRRLSNPYEWIRMMAAKGMIRITRIKGTGSHRRYYYCRESAFELIEMFEKQEEGEAIEAVRDRLIRESEQAFDGIVPQELRAVEAHEKEPSLEP